MGNLLNEISDIIIDNYLKADEELKYDGSFINHFASMVYTNNNKELNSKEIKEIRRYIKNSTNRMSSFRGDLLYILSLLIGATIGNWQEFTDRLLKNYEMLLEEHFEDSPYLVLSSYLLTKYQKEIDIEYTVDRMRQIYFVLKYKNDNVTSNEDYVICTILAMSELKIETIYTSLEYVEGAFNDEEELSNNDVQGVTTSLVLNKENAQSVTAILEEFEKREIKISNKFLPLIGAINYGESVVGYVDKVEEVIDYISAEESSYEFFMDKSFRTLISINIIEGSKKNRRFKYMDEIIAFGVYSFLISKNQGLFEQSLA